MALIIGGRPSGLRMCRGCGCDDNHACVTDDGPCAWVLLDFVIEPTARGLRVHPLPAGVCSRCAEELAYDMRELATIGIGHIDLDDEEAA